MKSNKFWNIIMMFVLVLGTTIAFSSCSKDDDDDITDKGNNKEVTNGLKGYYYSDKKNWETMLYFDGNGKGVKYGVLWEDFWADDRFPIGTFGGEIYYSNNINMESFVYYFTGNTVSIVGIKGYTNTIQIANEKLDGFVKLQ